MKITPCLILALIVFSMFSVIAFSPLPKESVLLSYADSNPSPIVNTTFTSNAPTTVTVTFPFSNTIHVEVNPVGGGLYTYRVSTSSPNSIVTIDLNGSDYYNIILAISYPTGVTGAVQWRVYGPGNFPEYQSVSFTNSSIVSQESLIQVQSYNPGPTAQQIANATDALMVAYQQHELDVQNQQLNQRIDAQNQLITALVIVAVGEFAFVLIIGLFVLYRLKRQPQ